MGQLIEAAQETSATTLTPDELRSGIAALTLAGLESASNLVASGIHMLSDTPELETLRRQPELWPNAVDEILRIEPPVQFTARRAIKDTEVAGVRVKRGELVMVYVAAANRDPSMFPEPHRFDIARPNAHRNLSFSGGNHLCPGNGLARLYGEVGLRTFFEHFPNARLAGAGTRKSMTLLRGWASLPVNL
jgi:cytochrome P450